ncbi:MAG: RluA family pseudouridine synthase [Rhodothermales bacterium]|jgi:RluA family pseudouridine synthase
MPLEDRRARTVTVSIPPDAAGIRIDAYLAKRFSYRTQLQWQEQMTLATLRVNEAPVAPDYLLEQGNVIAYDAGQRAEPPVPKDWQIAYEDPSMLVVNKPGGLPCHPSGAYFAHTLSEMLRSSQAEARIANRLDRETSGLVVFGLSKPAAGAIGKQFAARTVRKEYLVLVHGDFPDELEAEGFLERDTDCEVRKKRRFVTTPAAESAESATTRFRLISRGSGLSLVQALPHTGRLHQIRATLCSLGFPVVGDKIYGLDPGFFLRFIGDRLTAEDETRLIMPHQALHAWRLGLWSPHSGEEIEVAADLPATFLAAIARAGIRAEACEFRSLAAPQGQDGSDANGDFGDG